MKFITDCFKPTATNFHSYNYWKDYEAVAISLFKPLLNEKKQTKIGSYYITQIEHS